MDSPETTRAAPSAAAANSATPSPTVVQDSPFFTYVSNLSPIKPINNVRAPSTFRELSFPSPSPVFTSPHANPMRKGNLLKRSHLLSPDPGKFCLEYSGCSKDHSENASLGPNSSLSATVSVPCIMKDSECEFPMQLQPCSSPSGCVDEFLSDPMEDSVDSCGPSDLCLDQAAQLHQRSQNKYMTLDEAPQECIKSQNCCPSGCVNEILANQVECGKAIDSACVLSQDGVKNNVAKEVITYLDPHKDKMREGGVRSEERPIEERLRRASDCLGGDVEDYVNDDKSLCQCSEALSHDADGLLKDAECEEIAANVLGYNNSVDQDINEESSLVPKSRDGDPLDEKEEKVTHPLDKSLYALLHPAENGIGVELDSTPNMHTQPVKFVPLDNNHHDNSGASCNTSAENVIAYKRGSFASKLQSEGCQYQRAMCKRLQFDSGPSKLENPNASYAESVTTSSRVQVSQSAYLSGHGLPRSSSHLNQKAQTHIDVVARSIRNNGSSLTTAPRPSGIGLHLNSVVNVVAMNIHINVQSEKDLEKNNLNASGDMALCCSTQQRVNDSEVCLASMASTENVSIKSALNSYSLVQSIAQNSDDNQQEDQAVALPSSSASLMNPLQNSLQSTFLDPCIEPCSMKEPPPDDACGSEELCEMSPRNKRKKAPEDIGCKRCNCKKSKCLKLYCDCFAAGVYCAESCACQGCSNRSEYEDTVLETRKQIESRNPLAFAPKVVVRATEVIKTSGEEKKCINPVSARHKRGCNCKRSQCLKKYCECFQAKVGCSFGCRCEGCKNSYGKKDGVEIIETEHLKVMDEGCKNDLADGTDVVDIKGEVLNNDKPLRRLSPFTPLQEGCNGGNVSKSHYASRRYLSSSESAGAGSLISHGKSRSSPTNSGASNRLVKVREGNSARCPYNKDLEVPDADEVELFSPRWNRLAERCNLRLLPCSSPGDAREQTDSLGAPLFQRSSRILVNSSLWRGSPVTPMPQVGESRLSSESCSDTEPLTAHEDDTPDILKDSCVPDKGLKMSSPNKKRVSPPHKCLNEIKSSSSTSMRSRKFILKLSKYPLNSFKNESQQVEVSEDDISVVTPIPHLP